MCGPTDFRGATHSCSRSVFIPYEKPVVDLGKLFTIRTDATEPFERILKKIGQEYTLLKGCRPSFRPPSHSAGLRVEKNSVKSIPLGYDRNVRGLPHGFVFVGGTFLNRVLMYPHHALMDSLDVRQTQDSKTLIRHVTVVRTYQSCQIHAWRIKSVVDQEDTFQIRMNRRTDTLLGLANHFRCSRRRESRMSAGRIFIKPIGNINPVFDSAGHAKITFTPKIKSLALHFTLKVHRPEARGVLVQNAADARATEADTDDALLSLPSMEEVADLGYLQPARPLSTARGLQLRPALISSSGSTRFDTRAVGAAHYRQDGQ